MFRQIYQKVCPRFVRDHIWMARNVGITQAARTAVRRVRFAFGGRIAEVRLPHGHMYVDLADEGIGQVIYDKRDYEPHETQVLRNTLKPGMTFVDVGANIGYFTVLAAKLVGQTGKVVAFEPEPHNHHLLRRNVSRNRLTNVSMLRCALGATPGTAMIHRSATNFGDHRIYGDANSAALTQVSVETFDRAIAGQGVRLPDVVKMDTQGFECHILHGMEQFFAAGHPATVLTEYWPHGMTRSGGDPTAFLQSFANHGFTASVLTRDGRCLDTPVNSINDYLPSFDPCAPDGCYLNIVFTRPKRML
jgi:FkbM family methyltransferase